jgi:hypothetical protein
MIQFMTDDNSINTVSHLIQLAVAPVFLLAGMAGVLNVFVGRLSRIIDKAEILTEKIESHIEDEFVDKKYAVIINKRNYLQKRIINMNFAILSCTMTGFLVALVIMIMFMSSFFTFNGSFMIAVLFIMAMGAFVTALSLFLKEIFMANLYFRKNIENTRPLV